MKTPFQIFVGLLAGGLTAMIFSICILFPSRLIFLALSLLFLSMLTLLFYLLRDTRKEHTLSLTLTTAISNLLLFSILDQAQLRWFFVIFVSLLFTVLFGLNEYGFVPLGFARKPFRRFVMMIWVFNAYALFACLFAIGILFQSEWPVWIEIFLIPSSGLIAGFIAGQIWKMYVVGERNLFLFWQLVIGVFIAELFWGIRLLPYGYLVSGILLCWLWYLLQMLTRFHFQPTGIVWKKQLPFLIGSGMVFFFLAIFFIRWI